MALGRHQSKDVVPSNTTYLLHLVFQGTTASSTHLQSLLPRYRQSISACTRSMHCSFTAPPPPPPPLPPALPTGTPAAARLASLQLTAMYITSELFGGPGDAARLHCNNTASTYWNAMADSPIVAGLGKRKRLEGEQDPSAYGGNTRHPNDSETDCGSRTRPHHQQRLSSPNHRYHTKSTSITPPPFDTTIDRRPVKQMKRLSPKSTLTKSTSHLMDLEPELSRYDHDARAHSHSVTNLRPCHACNSAPRRKKDLENYLDCLRCDGRTCYICARQCFGGCGKAVCKKCIVEVGEDGDPWCLDCYARDINS